MAISADKKLDIYNGALLRIGSRKLKNLSEDREPRRVLDHFWGGSNQLVAYALERGDWNFAIRASQLEAETSVTPEFGWSFAYIKPDDFRRLSSLASDERFQNPLTYESYADEAGYWLSDNDPLYLRYVSDGNDFGFNSGIWTEGFIDFLEVRLARLACNRLSNDKGLLQGLVAEEKKALTNAKSVDALDEGVKFLPHGTWSGARSGRWGRRGDRSTSLP